MIPIKANNILDISSLEVEKQASKTYKLYHDKERVLNNITGLNAIEQMIYKTLNTERYKYLIYSWNYGVEFDDLIGKPIGYIKTELERRIKDALLIDDRIENVKDFTFTLLNKTTLAVKFTVVSINGNIEINKGVSI